MLTTVFIKWSKVATKETIYYKIELGLKFKFYEGQWNQKLVWKNRKPICQRNPVLTSLTRTKQQSLTMGIQW